MVRWPCGVAIFAGRRALGVLDPSMMRRAESTYGEARFGQDQLRLVRMTSCVRRCPSSSETLRLTVASGMPSARRRGEAAAVHGRGAAPTWLRTGPSIIPKFENDSSRI